MIFGVVMVQSSANDECPRGKKFDTELARPSEGGASRRSDLLAERASSWPMARAARYRSEIPREALSSISLVTVEHGEDAEPLFGIDYSAPAWCVIAAEMLRG